MAAQGYSDFDNQAPLHFKTTEEMLNDFAYFGEKVPSQIFWLGGGVADKTKRISNHNPKVCFSEDALPYGVAIYVQCAMEWLREHADK